MLSLLYKTSFWDFVCIMSKKEEKWIKPDWQTCLLSGSSYRAGVHKSCQSWWCNLTTAVSLKYVTEACFILKVTGWNSKWSRLPALTTRNYESQSFAFPLFSKRPFPLNTRSHKAPTVLDRRHGFSVCSSIGSLKPDGKTWLLSSMCALFLSQSRLQRIKRFDTWPFVNFSVVCCRYSWIPHHFSPSVFVFLLLCHVILMWHYWHCHCLLPQEKRGNRRHPANL